MAAKYCIYFWNDFVMDEEESKARSDKIYEMVQEYNSDWHIKRANLKTAKIKSMDSIYDCMSYIIASFRDYHIISKSPSDLIIYFDALSSISDNSRVASRVLYILDHYGYTVYITSLSFYTSVHAYLDKLSDRYNIFRSSMEHYNSDLLSWAEELRSKRGWKLQEIEDLTGVTRQALSKKFDSENCKDRDYFEVGSHEISRKEREMTLFLRFDCSRENAEELADFFIASTCK